MSGPDDLGRMAQHFEDMHDQSAAQRRTITGRWSPQITPEKPRERTNEGQRITLRRVQELPAHLRGWPLDEVQRAIEAASEATTPAPAEIESDGFITLHPPRHPATSIGE